MLKEITKLLAKHRLDVVLIGNAAAALQGSPVTTMDFDFMFRSTPTNLRKLRRTAADLHAVVMRPVYPASGLYRVVRDDDGSQLDFMSKVDGIRSFESLRSRATVARKRSTTKPRKAKSPLRRESDRALLRAERRGVGATHV